MPTVCRSMKHVGPVLSHRPRQSDGVGDFGLSTPPGPSPPSPVFFGGYIVALSLCHRSTATDQLASTSKNGRTYQSLAAQGRARARSPATPSISPPLARLGLEVLQLEHSRAQTSQNLLLRLSTARFD